MNNIIQVNVNRGMLMGAHLMQRYISDQLKRDIVEVGMFQKPFVVVDGIPLLPDLRQLAVNICLGSITLLGARPVAYQEENEGLIIREVRPFPSRENEVSSQGSVPLPLHTDMSFLRFPTESDHELLAAAPDFLILTCIKNESRVATRVVTINQIKLALDNESISELRKPQYSIGTPDSVTPRRIVTDRSIIYNHPVYGDMIRYDSSNTTAQTDEGRRALDNLKSFIEYDRTGEDIMLVPGQVLILNNRQVLHGRRAIPNGEPDRESGTQRYFMRVYAQLHDTEYASCSSSPITQSSFLPAAC